MKNLEAIQTCASVHEICVGKTGTLTVGQMKVLKYHICDQQSSTFNDCIDKFNIDKNIKFELRDLIKECIINNTDVIIENSIEDSPRYIPKGQPFEVGLIQFLFDNEEDIPNLFIDRNRYTPKKV